MNYFNVSIRLNILPCHISLTVGKQDFVLSTPIAMESAAKLTPEMEQKILNSPAMPPPNGTNPIFDNPPNQNDVAFEAIGACLAIELIFCFFRVYTRAFCMKKVRLEDCELNEEFLKTTESTNVHSNRHWCLGIGKSSMVFQNDGGLIGLTLGHQIFQIAAICVFASMSHRSGLFVHQYNLLMKDLYHFLSVRIHNSPWKRTHLILHSPLFLPQFASALL